MTDELDVLRHERDVIEPDPQFRADLMDRLRHSMVSGSDLKAGRAHLLDLDAPSSAGCGRGRTKDVPTGCGGGSLSPRPSP